MERDVALNGEQEMDRSQPATPYRLEEARRRGQVARSAELVGSVVLMAAALALAAKGASGVSAMLDGPRSLWTSSLFKASPGDGMAGGLALGALEEAFSMIAPPLGALMMIAVLASFAQTGPVWSTHPLHPDLTRLSPANGVRRVFCLRSLFDAARAVVKVVVVTAVALVVLAELQTRAGALVHLTPPAAFRLILGEIGRISLLLAASLMVVAVGDLLWTKHEFAKQLRMSRRELRDELRHREGDPRIRSRMRVLRREMLARLQAVSRTKDADFVVVNPVHVAVALRYRRGETAAPVVVAKGVGVLAAAIRRLASRHGVAVVQSPALARALNARVRLDAPIPPEHYADVARLVVWLTGRESHLHGAAPR